MAKAKKKNQAKTPSEVAPRPFKFVLYGDLHVREDTLDRCIATLGFVRELARDRKADGVICLGDFWDRRGVIRVRQLDAIQREFDLWGDIPHHFVPGNHDQVDREGRIHGLKIFDRPEWDWNVYTDPFQDGSIAFLPWREDPEVQAKLFASLPTHVTVFAHAEARGATANNGHEMGGRFVDPGVRAIYLAHFHKRQKIGDRIWYIGSPFEQDVGERDQPHGVAIVSHKRIEPVFFEVPGMPKHYVFHWPEDSDRLSVPEEQDIVEVWASPEDLESEDFEAALLDGVRSADVRTFPMPVEASDESPVPALTVDEAVVQYAQTHEGPESMPPEDLLEAGKSLLQAVDHERVKPLASVVRPRFVEVEGFCKVPGSLRVELENQGLVLLRGPMGSGKTALLDAIDYCYFETTTPRQDASASSGFRGDEVINDHVEECVVRSEIQAGDSVYEVERKRKRGKSAKVKLKRDGKSWDTGTVDHGDQLRRLIGMDLVLWRAVVHLGQGSVSNFVTETNKGRLELLAHVAGVEVCPKVVKKVRSELKEVEREAQKLDMSLASLRSKADTLRGLSYEAESRSWEARRTSALEQHNARIQELKSEVERIDQHLPEEPKWIAYRDQVRTQIEDLRSQRNQAEPSAQIVSQNQALGQAQAEHAAMSQALDQLVKSRDSVQNNATCPTCFQSLPAEDVESRLENYERDIVNKREHVQILDNKINQLRYDLGQLKADPVRVQMIDSQIKDLEPKLEEANKALHMIDRIRDKRENLIHEWNRVLKEIEAKQNEENPFRAKAAAHAQELGEIELVIESESMKLKQRRDREAVLRYWEQGFGQKGIPSMVLQSISHDLETRANYYLSRLTDSTISVEIKPEEGGMDLVFWEREEDELWERGYKQLSGGQRRCVQIAFTPFALSDMVFNRLGIKIPLVIIDELTTHMDSSAKTRVCEILAKLGRETVLVADHDVEVQGVFDNVIDVEGGALVV